MFLKRIELNGFKSFANKTELIINSGVTGVIGPNGSGKSNIADAIRWVLGEQSSKNLRGSKMEDVIFNGSQTRPKKAFCQVSLVFDNDNHLLESDYAEITITRKMYRTGESEYLVNNSSVRLKDVLELIRGTGIGKDGYSIVGQGRIDEILASKPTARRRVFEEAAGIVKYRVRKEEAEDRLQKTDENLIRVEDILEELSLQIEPLREEAERTQEYLTLYDRQRVLDSTLFVMNYEKMQERKDTLTEELSLLEQELEETKLGFERAEQETAKLNAEMDALTIESESAVQSLSAFEMELERLCGEQKVLDERSSNQKKDKLRLEQQKAESESALATLVIEIEAQKELKCAATKLHDETRARLETISNSSSAQLSAYEESQRKLEQLTQEHLSLLEDSSHKNSALSALSERVTGVSGKRGELEARLSEAEQAVELHTQELEKEKTHLSELNAEHTGIVSRVNETNISLKNYNQTLDQLKAELSRQERTLGDMQSRRKLLMDLKLEYEGYSDSVRGLMRAAAKQLDLSECILGTLAELITVPSKYETAIETVLGGALQNVVVEDEYDAKALIQLLHEKRLGRVTFLPLQALRVNTLSTHEASFLDMPGVLMIASEALEYDSNIAPAVEFLLARTVIVDSMDNAIALMRASSYSFRAVTLSGEVLRPGGVITGGSSGKKQFGLLSRTREITTLETDIDSAIKKAGKKREEILKLESDITIHMKSAEELLHNLKEIEICSAGIQERIAGISVTLNNQTLLKSTLSTQLYSVQDESDKAIIEQEALLESLLELKERIACVENDIRNVRQDVSERKNDLDGSQRVIGELRVTLAEQKKELEKIEQTIARINSESEKLSISIKTKEYELANGGKEIENIISALAGIQQDILNGQIKKEKLSENCMVFENKRRELKERTQLKQNDFAEYQTKQAGLLERKYKSDAQLEKVIMSIDNISNKIWEDYSLTFGGAQELSVDIPFADANKELQDVHSRIRALGVVNPNALESYRAVSERLEELTGQRDDLKKAEQDLLKLIDELTNTMRTSFKQSFNLINTSFKRIFSDLFGGGRADLSFEEGDIIECGIEIAAEPPGKKLQNISLLSGGERALTAIALLFAMMEVNPSPLCLLDEIDAPLDEANVIRLGGYLGNLRTTQLLVITHRKPTMSICDTLYGVAMEEKGVSRLVSVHMESAVG